MAGMWHPFGHGRDTRNDLERRNHRSACRRATAVGVAPGHQPELSRVGAGQPDVLARTERRLVDRDDFARPVFGWQDRKSTRLNSSHVKISYAVICLKRKMYSGEAK